MKRKTHKSSINHHVSCLKNYNGYVFHDELNLSLYASTRIKYNYRNSISTIVSNYPKFDTLISFQRGQYLSAATKFMGKNRACHPRGLESLFTKLSPTTFNWTVHTTLRKVDSQRCTHGGKMHRSL